MSDRETVVPRGATLGGAFVGVIGVGVVFVGVMMIPFLCNAVYLAYQGKNPFLESSYPEYQKWKQEQEKRKK